MPVFIPMTPDGDRVVTVNTGSGVYAFRSYYASGFERRWLLDIADAAGTPLLGGATVVNGCANLLQGQGEKFHGVQLAAALISGDIGGEEALGETLLLVWYNEGEENDFPTLDPMETLSLAGLL